MTKLRLKMNLAELEAFLSREFPQGFGPGRPHSIISVSPGTAKVRLRAGEDQLRPGGTVSGPSLMGAADAAVYVAILAVLGPVAHAVTTNLSINFFKRPQPGDIIADCKLLKTGKRLVIGEVAMRAEGDEELVAHCVATYSVPPR